MKKNGQIFPKSILSYVLLLSAFSLATPAYSASLSDIFGSKTNQTTTSQNPKVVPVNEAFSVFPEQKGNVLTVRFEVKDGYYLYQNKIKLELPDDVTASPLQFSLEPNSVNDPEFGQVPVFEKTFTATTTLNASAKLKLTSTEAMVKWQGCAKAGLCYPPEKTPFTLTQISPKKINKPTAEKSTRTPIIADSSPSQISPNQNTPAIENATSSTASTAFALPTGAITNNASVASTTTITKAPTIASSVATTDSKPATSVPLILDDTTRTQDNDPFGLNEHFAWALVLLYLAGLGLAFTPCVLPMLPIVANIVARQHSPSTRKSLLLTGSYAVGVAMSYGVIGALVAVFGASLGILNWLQNPVILLSFAGLFVVLGLYMLDLLPIRLPSKLRQKLENLSQVGDSRLGSGTGSFTTGFLSALVVSPCVSAPLAGALAGVATTANPVMGFFALFVLGLGLSTPLVLLGATQGNIMPKSGAWMTWVKTGFALLLFAVALLMVERVWHSSLMLGLWAVWFAVVATWAWQWAGRGKLVTKALTFLLAIWSVVLLVGMAMGNTDSWQPLKSLTAKQTNTNQPQRITQLSELTPLVAGQGKVLVDVTADWCIECRIMDKNLFANPPSAMQDWQFVHLDVTEDNATSRQIYEQLKVFGPPVLLYFDNGKLVYRQNGEVKRDDFEQALVKLK